MFAGWFSVGARFVFAIVSVVVAVLVALPVPVPSFTVKMIGKTPASENPGVPVTEAVRGETPGEFVVNVRSAGMPDCVIVSVFAASASVADTLMAAIAEPSAAEAVDGATICGWLLGVAGA